MTVQTLERPPLDFDLPRKLAAEALGSALLLTVVVGSGIMGQRLSDGNDALALLANSLATGCGLVVLIWIFGPVSGAHFNPVVTLVAVLRRELSRRMALTYVPAQIAGAALGVWAAHLMFGLPVLQVSTHARTGGDQLFAEAVATFGLLATILGTARVRPEATPVAVGLYITAAYWFTASTSFANPAVTLARALTNTFAGIAPGGVPAFILAQIAGALVATAVFGWLLKNPENDMTDPDFPVVIFHNPDCGTSRNVVAMVRAAGYEPTVVEYLKTGWSQEQLLDLAARAGLGLKALMRTKGTPAEALGLLADDVGAAQILEAMLTHPILVNRPLVQTPKGVKLCRPSEVVFDLLERRPDVFVKEDSEIIRF